jgi:transposase InsO family protein
MGETGALPGQLAAQCPHPQQLIGLSNAFAERFVRSIKQECLRHLVPLGARHLRRTVGEFVAHYHSERNHQGLGNVIPFPAPGPPDDSGPIRRRERLGGLINFYERNAA